MIIIIIIIIIVIIMMTTMRMIIIKDLMMVMMIINDLMTMKYDDDEEGRKGCDAGHSDSREGTEKTCCLFPLRSRQSRRAATTQSPCSHCVVIE